MVTRPRAERRLAAYERPEWLAQRIDPDGVLAVDERRAAVETAQRRIRDVLARLPEEYRHDKYDAAAVVLRIVRDEHCVDEREPIPTTRPIDLDHLKII